MKKSLAIFLVTAVMLLMLSTVAGASVADKQILAHYNDVKLYTNNELVSVAADQEPFIINGVTYVPLRVAGQSLKSDVTWVADTKSIYITPAANTEQSVQLAQKDTEIAQLKAQIATLQKELDNTTTSSSSNSSASSNSSTASLKTIADDLYDDYGVFEDVMVYSFTLSGDEDDVSVDIKVNMSKYDDEWAELTDSQIRDWLVDVTKYIQKKLDSTTVIDGKVRTTDNERLLTFTKNGTGTLKITYYDSDYRNQGAIIADDLVGTTYKVDTLSFTATTVTYSKTNQIVKVEFRAKSSDAANTWQDLKTSVINNAIEDIGDDIADEFEDEKVDVEQVRMYFYNSTSSSLIYSDTYQR